MVFIHNCFLQAVMYIVKVVVSKKWYKIDTLSLHTIVIWLIYLCHFQGHSRNAGLIKCNSTNFCATFSMVLTDTALRVVSRRQLSFLWNFILALYVILWWLKMF